MSGTIAEDARSRPPSTRMYCKAGPVKIRLAARAVPDLDPGPLSPRAQAATACRVPLPALEWSDPGEIQSSGVNNVTGIHC